MFKIIVMAKATWLWTNIIIKVNVPLGHSLLPVNVVASGSGMETPPSASSALQFQFQMSCSQFRSSRDWEQSKERDCNSPRLETTAVRSEKCEGCSEELLSKSSKLSLQEDLVDLLFYFFGGFRNGHFPLCVILTVASHKRFSTWNTEELNASLVVLYLRACCRSEIIFGVSLKEWKCSCLLCCTRCLST